MLNTKLIKKLIEAKGITQKKFILEADISEPSFYKIIKTGKASSTTVIKIASALSINPERLYSFGEHSDHNVIYVPISAQAGFFHDYSQISIETKSFWLPEIGESQHHAFNVSGDSMSPTLMHGDIVVGIKITTQEDIKPGAVHVLFDKVDGVVVKRLKVQGKEIIISSDNPKYQPYAVTAKSITQIYRVKRVITANI
jgi:phage repressor protein C with HTH and peptisase S24 domain